MNGSSVTFVRDEPWLSHVVIRHGDRVEREVIEIRSGEWKPELIQYLEMEGNRLDLAGYKFQTEPATSSHWMRFVFKKERPTEGD